MNVLPVALVAAALIVIQLAISGTRLVFSIPSYVVLAICALIIPFLKRHGREPSKWCMGVTAVFFAYILARAYLSPVEYLARTDIYMVLACLAAYGISALHIHKPGMRNLLMICIFGLAIAEVVMGIRQFAGDFGWMPFGFLKEPNQRASGSFISPIHFAGFLEAVAPFAIAIAIWGNQRPWVRWLCYYVALLCYVGVVISGSRGGWLASLFSLVVLACIGLFVTFRLNRPGFPAAVYAIILGAVMIPAVSYPLMMQSDMLKMRLQHLTEGVNGKNSTYDIRLANWAAAIDQWKEQPVWGTGAGTHLYYGRLYRRPQLQADPEHAHGDYLELLAEYGIIGAIGMAAFLSIHWFSGVGGLRRMIREKETDPYGPSMQLAYSIGALTAFSAHAAHAVVDFNMHLPGNAIFLAVIFGFLANSGDVFDAEPASLEEPDAEPEPQKRSVAVTIAGCSTFAIGVWILAAAAPKFPGEYWCERARVAVRARQFEEAIQYGSKALEWESRNPFIHLHMGQAHRIRAELSMVALRKPMYQEAIIHFEKGIGLFPQDEELWVRYAQALEGRGDFKAAGEAYRSAIKLDPNLGVIRRHYSRFLMRVGREAEAEHQANLASEAARYNLSTLPGLGFGKLEEEQAIPSRVD